MAKFRIVHLPPGEKSKKNVVRVKVKVRDLKPSKNPKGGAPPGPITRPNVSPRHGTYPLLDNGRKSVKRTFALILAALAAAALFGGLVHAVLVVAHVSEPAATTVYGLTSRRLWATTVALVALVGVVIGGLALRRSDAIGTGIGRRWVIVALVAGLIAAVNGGLNLAIAKGGPGSGNGVVGGAAALVLGMIGMVIAGII